MNVCFVVPPSAFLLDERVFMTLGVLRIAASLELLGYHVEMLDLSGVENYVEAVRAHAQRSRATSFGVTATTPQLPAAAKVCQAIRETRHDARVILGGPHATLVNAAARREQHLGIEGRGTKALHDLHRIFDVVVAGDGEDAIVQALGHNPPRLIDADDPKSPFFLSGSRLGDLPFPARHLVDVESYHYSVDGVRALSLIAQLGCPFECGFCGGRESPSFRRARIRATHHVLAEIRHLYGEYGIRGFMFYDDELNVNRKMIEMMRAISDLQRELGTEFRLRGFIKAELFTDEQAEAMQAAGFRWILTGFESGAPAILRNINKKATREENTRCVDIARRHGLKVKALMSIGHPGESSETVAQTHDWLLDVRPDDFDVTIITTYPGTPYYDHAVRLPDRDDVWVYTAINGDRLYQTELDYTTTADYYKGDPDGGYRAFVFTDYMSSDELVDSRDRLERRIREQLGIPFSQASASIRYEHSMGQSHLPPNVLRTSASHAAPATMSVAPVPALRAPVPLPLIAARGAIVQAPNGCASGGSNA